MQDLKIRRYKTSDKPIVWELHRLSLAEIGAMPNHDNPWDQDMNNIEEVYLKGGDFLVGKFEGKILAMAAFKRTDDETAELKRLRVHPDFQRKGLGRTIVEELEKRAKSMGYKRMVLSSDPRWIKAQKFYIKMGYQEIKRGLVWGKFYVIFYEKDLV